ncbi:hypothetical protein [Paracoccus aminovorans]|uniref:hypothetical protein n=1 Tax=Paracoccus aminovorans TaxID=34004 RepID=UPI002B25DDB0|nr:hypothetical protein [Paracoccus aminovorans]
MANLAADLHFITETRAAWCRPTRPAKCNGRSRISCRWVTTMRRPTACAVPLPACARRCSRPSRIAGCGWSLHAGGSSFWLATPEGGGSQALAKVLKARDVLIQPGTLFSADPIQDERFFRLAYSSISAERIPRTGAASPPQWPNPTAAGAAAATHGHSRPRGRPA